MLPKMPPRGEQVGFVYAPPYRIQGISIAGEQTTVQIPELDLAFDIGLCPRTSLASPYVALSHTHMDHIAALPYYFSQRMFQRMGVGTCFCHADMADSINFMLDAWIDLERQRTERRVIPLAPGDQYEIKNNIHLRAVEVSHTLPALGYAVVERRSKLREEFIGLPQTELREIKSKGTEITRTLEIPLVAYTGDTEFCPQLFSDEFASAPIVITECTFFDPDHKSRAKIGKHLHIDDIAQLLNVWQAHTIVLVHLTRRTHIIEAREYLNKRLGKEHADRLHFLMDHHSNRRRYETMREEAAAAEAGANL